MIQEINRLSIPYLFQSAFVLIPFEVSLVIWVLLPKGKGKG